MNELHFSFLSSTYLRDQAVSTSIVEHFCLPFGIMMRHCPEPTEVIGYVFLDLVLEVTHPLGIIHGARSGAVKFTVYS